MLAKPVTGWENRFPSTTHYHNCCRKAITNLYKFRPQIYQKVPAGKEKLSQPGGSFQLCRSLSSCHSFSICLPCSLSKMPASGEAKREQDFQPLTVVLVLSCFLKLLDWLIPLLLCNALFLSQLVRDLGWPATPYSPPPSRKDCMPQSNTESLPFQGFCGMI